MIAYREHRRNAGRLPALIALGLALAGGPSSAQSLPARDAPNVLLILLDDVDWGDLRPYNAASEIVAPSVDRLASEGMRFSQHYSNGAFCTPTRMALLTGHYPSRYGLRRALGQQSHRGIPGDVLTLPEALRRAGYRTGHVGKWHVGSEKAEFLPNQRGFEHSVRLVDAFSVSNYSRFLLSFDGAAPVLFDQGEHLTEVLTDHALRFLEHDAGDRPFFLNLWYFAAHEPLDPPAGFDYARYGYDPSTERGRFAALVTNVDLQIGRLLAKLDELDLARDTLVLFTSDNGGSEDIHLGIPGRLLRGGKSRILEGGIRTPLIVRWPAAVPAGMANDTPVASMDAFPTLAAVAGADGFDPFLGGRSYRDVLESGLGRSRGQPLFWETRRKALYFHESQGRYVDYAVRLRNWKLVCHLGYIGLHDIDRDIGESINRARERPEVVHELQGHYQRGRWEVGTIPYRDSLSLSGSAVERQGILFFDAAGGAARIAPSARFDFHNGDFSLITRVRPRALSGERVIAQKQGSWRLGLSDDEVFLEVRSTDGPRLRLHAGPLPPDREVHLAFAAKSWGVSPTTFALFVDGLRADLLTAGVESVQPSDHPILIGNDELGGRPFRGTIWLPVLSSISLTDGEIANHFRCGSPGGG